MRVSKRVGIILLVILFLIALAAGVLYFQYPHANFDFLKSDIDFADDLPVDQILSPEELRMDAEFILAEIERSHPAFVREPEIFATWNKSKERYLSECEREMSVSDFEFSTNRMLRSLNDGHTTVYLRLGDEFADLEWTLRDDRLFLNEGPEIVQIGGLATQDYLAFLSDYFTTENPSETKHRVEGRVGRSKAVLQQAGAKVDDTLQLTLKDGEKKRQVDIDFSQDLHPIYDSQKPNISYKLMDDIFYIEFLACELTDELEDTANALSEALKNGITKIIIDVRENGGGDSLANDRLFKALQINPPTDDIEIRLSPLSRSFSGTVGTDGYIVWQGNQNVRHNNKIQLVILTSAQTYSSAMMLALHVQDGSLGTVIGEIPGNNANSYGDKLTFQAPKSRILVGVSYKYWQRPDDSKESWLIPDIETEASDALDRALKYLKEGES